MGTSICLTLGVISGTFITLLIMASREHAYRKMILEKQFECLDWEYRILLKKNNIAIQMLDKLDKDKKDNQEINEAILMKLDEI